MNKNSFTYKKSGVDIKAADKFVKFISSITSKKRGKKKFNNIGGFGSITDIPNKIKNPKIVATILGFLILFGISVIDPNPPILLNFFLPLFFDVMLEMNFTNLSAALISTPLFLYVKEFLFIIIK